MTAPRPMVDIIIPGYENLPLTRRLLKSLRQTQGVPCNVIYVDNGSSPYDVGQLLNDNPSLCLVRHNNNLGFVRAINIGTALAMMSPAPFILWLNNDVEIPAGDPTWLLRLLEPFGNSEVAATGPVSNNVFGMQRRETAGAEWIDVPILIGFALCLRKEALLGLSSPFLDEHFGMGNYEDWDLSLRLRERGGHLIINETVWLHHKMHATFDKMPIDLEALLARNLAYLVDKWTPEKLHDMGIDLQTADAAATVAETGLEPGAASNTAVAGGLLPMKAAP